MTATPKKDIVTTGSRALRVGIVQAGKIVEERIIHAGQGRQVTIGSSARCTIVEPSLPRRIALFSCKNGRHRMLVQRTTQGRVAMGGGLLTMDEIRQQGQPQGRKGLIELRLSGDARGKVSLGAVTVLFQLVAPPPLRPRPQLPASIRGGLLGSMDRVLVASLVGMAVINFGFVGVLRAMTFPPRPVITKEDLGWLKLPKPKLKDPALLALQGEAPVRVVKVLHVPAPKPQPSETKDPVRTPRPPGPQTHPRPAPPRCDAACKARRKARNTERLRRLVGTMGVLPIIGHKGRHRSGAMRDLLRPGNPGAELAKAIGRDGLVVSRRGAQALNLRRRPGRDAGEVTTIKDLHRRVVGPVASRPERRVKDRIPRLKLNKKPVRIPDGGIGRDAAYYTLRRGMSCVQASYERTLKRNRGIQGKVEICLELNSTGKVLRTTTRTDTTGDSELSQRIRGCMQRLRFPPLSSQSARVCVPFMLRRAGL